MLSSVLIEVLPQPGTLGLRKELDESRLGRAFRDLGICRKRVEATTGPQLPETSLLGYRVGALEDWPVDCDVGEQAPLAVWELLEVNHLMPLRGKPRQDDLQVLGSRFRKGLPIENGSAHVPKTNPRNGILGSHILHMNRRAVRRRVGVKGQLHEDRPGSKGL